MNAKDPESGIFGYAFSGKRLLEEALTTPSCKIDNGAVRDNQRLEFLGDAVLGLVAAARLYSKSPAMDEGALTVKRSSMVSSASLCAAAAGTDLASRLKRNKGAKPLSPDAKTIADAVEAVIGAAWLDGGLKAVETMFDFLKLDSFADGTSPRGNPKGDLQIATQSRVPPVLPKYTLVSVSGKAHEPVFTVEVSADGIGSARSEARSRKEAETAAAAKLLETMQAKRMGGTENG